MSKSLTDEFSTRRKEIEKQLKDKGFSSAKAAEYAALSTREVKGHAAREELFNRWQERGKEHGFSSEQVQDLMGKATKERDLGKEKEQIIREAIEKITAHSSHFSERDFVGQVAVKSQGRGLGVDEVVGVSREHLANSKEIVALGRVDGEQRFTTREMLEIEQGMLKRVDKLV